MKSLRAGFNRVVIVLVNDGRIEEFHDEVRKCDYSEARVKVTSTLRLIRDEYADLEYHWFESRKQAVPASHLLGL